MKIIDGKITSINGEIHISWQMDDNSWTEAKAFNVPDATAQDVVALKQWCQNYKNAYNTGKDHEAAQAAIPEVPPEVENIINQSLNLE